MPDIPNVPGVPALSGYASDANVPLLFADAPSVLTAFIGPTWGVYASGIPVIIPAGLFGQSATSTIGLGLSAVAAVAALIGLPNIVPVVASTVEFDFSAESPISTYPQEQGAFQSYDKIQLPYDIKMKLAVGGPPVQRQAFLSTLAALRTSLALLDIVTPEAVFTSCNCKHFDYRRTASNGVQLIVADVWFEEVRVAAGATFLSTQQPGDAAPQSIGNVQPQSSTAISGALAAGNGVF